LRHYQLRLHYSTEDLPLRQARSSRKSAEAASACTSFTSTGGKKISGTLSRLRVLSHRQASKRAQARKGFTSGSQREYYCSERTSRAPTQGRWGPYLSSNCWTDRIIELKGLAWPAARDFSRKSVTLGLDARDRHLDLFTFSRCDSYSTRQSRTERLLRPGAHVQIQVWG